MASARSVSPGAALLRTSRLFSLPAPLPPPTRETSDRMSETATQIYPSRQVITTTGLSRRTGDWGLKRPLPLKTTLKSSNPMIKVNQVDSIESITDFSPGSDHGITLRKFQEMNVPITVPGPKSGMNLPSKSVFEDDFDFTAVPKGKDRQEVDIRWKFKGPWLAGLTDGELHKYIEKHVRNRREAFRKFLRVKLAKEMNETAAEKAKDAAEQPPRQIRWWNITDEQLVDFRRRLRDDRPRLYRLVSQFLDLAPIAPPKTQSEMWNARNQGQAITLTANNPYAQEGPPITHPSAGLSYLRTASYLENHPFYGPQAKHAPVEARVIAPRMSNGSRGAKLGVGGFVTNVPTGDSTFNMARASKVLPRDAVPGLERLDPNIKGGAKVWVEPLSATVNSRGQTVLTVGQTNKAAELVAKEMAGEDVVFETKREGPKASEDRAAFRRLELKDELGTTVIGSSKTYGLSDDA